MPTTKLVKRNLENEKYYKYGIYYNDWKNS